MRILLAIDDSKYSQRAIRELIAQVRKEGAIVTVLNVVEPAFTHLSEDTGLLVLPYVAKKQRLLRRQARQLVQNAVHSLRKAGFHATGIVREGDPKQKILDFAAQCHADLIFIGSHGRTALGRFLLGSVSEAVTRHAKCSVQVVRLRRAAQTIAETSKTRTNPQRRSG